MRHTLPGYGFVRRLVTARVRWTLRGTATATAVIVSLGSPPAARAQHPDLGEAQPADEVCLQCHDDVRQALSARSHKAVEAGCVTCHDLKKAAPAPFLRTELNALCLACHHAVTAAGGVAPLEIGRGYSIPGTFVARMKQLNLDARGVGHPVANHPVAGVADPAHGGKPMTCLSCHVPHGGASPRLLAFEVKPGQGVCQQCHEF